MEFFQIEEIAIEKPIVIAAMQDMGNVGSIVVNFIQNSLKTKKFRYVLASLALFKKIKNWHELYRLAKKNNLVREIGALYNLTEIIFPKIKKMPKFYANRALPKKIDKFTYIIPPFKSRDYIIMEDRWKVHIPFNKRDLEEYKI